MSKSRLSFWAMLGAGLGAIVFAIEGDLVWALIGSFVAFLNLLNIDRKED